MQQHVERHQARFLLTEEKCGEHVFVLKIDVTAICKELLRDGHIPIMGREVRDHTSRHFQSDKRRQSLS